MNSEKTVIDWLNSCDGLDGWTACADLPADDSAANPGRYVTVERVGGTDSPFVSRPLLAIQVWGETRWQCAQIAHDTVLPRLLALPEMSGVAAVDILGVTNMPTSDGRPRYQISMQLACDP